MPKVRGAPVGVRLLHSCRAAIAYLIIAVALMPMMRMMTDFHRYGLTTAQCEARFRSRPTLRVPMYGRTTFSPAGMGAHCGGTSVVTQIYSKTTDAMLERILSWAEELGPHVALWVLADDSSGDGARRRLEDLHVASLRRSQRAAGLQVSRFSAADIGHAFPVLADLAAAYAAAHRMKVGLTWAFTTEAVLLWWRRVREVPPCYIWVLEPDVSYSGNLSHFVGAYGGTAADLVSVNITPLDKFWPWKGLATQPFFRVAGHGCHMLHKGMVMRWSHQLLITLQAYAEAGISAYSEMMVPTVCMASGLSYTHLRPEHMGATFAWNGKVSEEAWARILAEPEFVDRWWHALKW